MNLKTAIRKSAQTLGTAIPMILGILMLISLFNTLVPVSSYRILFRGTAFDPLLGAILGSVVAGNPVTSYIISGDLLRQGISLLTVTAFLTAWVTVGVIQLPIEIQFFGKKFALLRNLSAFVLSLVVAVLTVLILSII
ncbi:hypothetical protein LA303_03805 [Candidatus Sulfidibacterium hydrothermale]|uniref:hypothetical protein n=1 Tax=Candidatus Sulfidibacterium hydrothermale TaxID=2875962 RepID=UPI001F0B6ABA|nr:hypothetical protein [Candidatus Sulfidibacterium hydrothermale]UBM63106.1 hypothetical protein LA303_03805 [Candidatus Sulfidibacterium hydrothermale]